jgi:iron(III) transport system substrate-binding protein
MTAGFFQPLFAQPGPALDMRVLEGAMREQKLVFYITMDLPQMIQVVHDFVQKYSFLALEIHPLETQTLVERVRTEARNGVAGHDVVIGGSGLLQPLFEDNLMASYRSPERASVSEALIDSRGYWSGYYINPLVLGYNTILLKEEEVPKSYDALLAPRWRGKRIVIDSTAHGLLRGLVPIWGKHKAVAYLESLAAQQPLLARASIAAVEAVHNGSVSMAIARAPVIQGYKEKMASAIDWRHLEPVVAQIDAVMVSAQSPHPHAARLFVDFALSAQGQNALARVQHIPVRRDINPQAKPAAQGQQWFLERPDSHDDYQETVRLFRHIFGIQ